MKKLSFLIVLPLIVLASCGGKTDSNPDSNPDSFDRGSSSIVSSDVRSSSSNAASSSTIASSSKANSSSQKDQEGPTVINTSVNSIPITINYEDAYFTTSSNVFNKDLAIFAYGASINTGSKEDMNDYFAKAGFTNAFLSASYNVAPTDDSIACAFASKNTDNGKVVVAVIRGFNYGFEWHSNFDIGKTGNHHGFEMSAQSFIADFNNYVTTNDLQSSKVLVTGYSRGGAVANVAADLLFKEDVNQKLISDENYYFYTFEAPRGLAIHEAYNNVFNVINSADLITEFAPEEYGLYRCGIDIDIYNADADNITKKFSDTINLPAFSSSSDYADEHEFNRNLISNLTNKDVEVRNISTRENFVDNAQPTVQYIMKMFFSLSDATVNKLKDDVSADYSAVLPALSSGEGMHDFIKPYLDEDGLVYDDDELMAYCNVMQEFLVQGPGGFLLVSFLLAKDNLLRAISMHYPDVNYALLKAYSPVVEEPSL